MTGMYHHTQLLLVEVGSHELFAQVGLELILLISASQVARIIVVSHCAQCRLWIIEVRKDLRDNPD
jgi:hypothetical protein